MLDRCGSSCRIGMAILLSAASGCGVYTPEKDPFSSNTPVDGGYGTKVSRQGGYESGLVSHIACEISHGLADADANFHFSWLKDSWGTSVTLSMTVADQTGL